MFSPSGFEPIEQKLQSLASPGIRPGLARLSKLLSLAGNPERKFKAVHIVGTNGKGSTASTLASILREAGYRTALYTSPHLVSFGERLEINGVQASPEKWDSFITKTERLIEGRPFFKDNMPTYFEFITAIAFMIIADADVDAAVVEAGLGGRLDATNILGDVALTVITPIGVDHEEYLGCGLVSIAKEKFAVMRPGVPAIFAGGAPEVEEAFFRRASIVKTPAQVLRRLCSHTHVQTTMRGTDFCIEAECLRSDYHTPLIGAHQADNAALAITAACALRKTFVNIDFPALYNGVSGVKWRGRFEALRRDPALIVDGAHNPHAMKRLAETLSLIEKGKKFNIALAMMKDKDVDESLGLLKQLDPVIFCTQVPDMERSMTSKELLKHVTRAGLKTAGEWADPLEAIKESLATGKDTICCGSLYLVGYVSRALGRKNNISFN